MTGTRLTVVVGTNNNTGDITPIAYLGVTTNHGGAELHHSATPAALSVVQGNQGTSTISTTISGGFDSAISLSATGVPAGTTVSFSPNPIAAPGSGSSTMTMMVGATRRWELSDHGDGQWRRGTAQLHGNADGDGAGAAGLYDNSLAGSLECGARQSGDVDDYDDDHGGFQQCDQPVVQRSSRWGPRKFQSQPDSGAGSGSSTMTVMVGASTALGRIPSR